MKGIEHNEQMGDWYEDINELLSPKRPTDTTSANESPIMGFMIGIPIGMALWWFIINAM